MSGARNLKRRASTFGAGLLACLVAAQASAQTPSAPPPASPSAVKPPPANVDPRMQVTPEKKAQLPTPVIHPPLQKGDTVIVPK